MWARSAFVVAVLGVIAPTILGWGAGAVLLPSRSWAVHMFLGATLCATSVGITARVLRDLGKSKTKEAQIVLGAAVIDDVLGLLVLSVVQGIILSLSVPAGHGGRRLQRDRACSRSSPRPSVSCSEPWCWVSS